MSPARMTSGITIFGDPHGDFSTFHDAVKAGGISTAIFLGDMDLIRPFEQETADLIASGGDVYWIVGNHDTDGDSWHDFLFGSKLADRNIGGRVVDIDGLRIAGLGGVFRGAIWNPRVEPTPRYATREDFMKANQRFKWRGGLPRKHRSTIFPEDIEALSKLRADILVTHEAPSNHEFGFAVIDELAERMGVKTIIHGHHHRAYETRLPNGIEVIGVAQAGTCNLTE